MSTDFSTIDRLVEFGMGMSVAQQMVNTMNRTMNTMQVAGVNAGTTGQMQQAVAPQPPVTQWYAVVDGNQAGPLSEQELLQLVRQMKIKADTFLWSPGMTGWQMASKIPQVNKLLLLQ